MHIIIPKALAVCFACLACTSAFARPYCSEVFEKPYTVLPAETSWFISEDSYWMSDSTNGFYFQGNLNNGRLYLTAQLVDRETRTRSYLRGEDLFDRMMAHFGAHNIDSIESRWFPRSIANYSVFYWSRENGLSVEESAFNTWLGRQAYRYGFVSARIHHRTVLDTPNPRIYSYLQAEFMKNAPPGPRTVIEIIDRAHLLTLERSGHVFAVIPTPAPHNFLVGRELEIDSHYLVSRSFQQAERLQNGESDLAIVILDPLSAPGAFTGNMLKLGAVLRFTNQMAFPNGAQNIDIYSTEIFY